MESIDDVEAQLLRDTVGPQESQMAGNILYIATFDELQQPLLNYETLQWIIISLVLILAWGLGLLLLLYTPVRRYVMRRDIRSRQLYVTSEAIVYKVLHPFFLPWLRVLKMEKCILLSLITDIVVEQGCLQSLFGLHSIRIETLRQASSLAGDNLHICGVSDPKQFQKVVLAAATMAKHDGSSSIDISAKHGGRTTSGLVRLGSENSLFSHSSSIPRAAAYVPKQYFHGEIFLKRLEDLKDSVKRIERLIECQMP